MDFTLDEWVYMVGVMNGVLCQPETLLANLFAGSEFDSMPVSLPHKLNNLSDGEIEKLYGLIYEFWNIDGYHIDNTEQRLIDIGALIPVEFK